MSVMTIISPLHWCRCGHDENEHRQWMLECNIAGCSCVDYKRSRNRAARAARTGEEGTNP